MTAYFIKDQDFNKFVNALLKSLPVVAPVVNQKAFSFDHLQSAKDLRLDYDITLLPPKKVFFPPKQHLFYFNKGKFESCLKPKAQVLLGVHRYDLNAIKQTDFLFSENYNDVHYSANRNATTLVGSNIQTVSKRAFWSSYNTENTDRIEDAFLTKLDKHNRGYLFEVLTDKGEQLLSFGQFVKATSKQINHAIEVNKSIADKCPEQLNYTKEDIGKVLRNSFNNIDLWQQLAQDCFSCGSCNTTCPTCYCFNIEDNWEPNQSSGYRTRYWDSCMTEDFAKISSGAGHSENFRETAAQRMRHRMMRKMVYLNDKLGTQACVGCGRCAIACTADIADPVDIVNKIMAYQND